MRKSFKFIDKYSKTIQCYKWTIENPRAIIYISHGMAENCIRYDEFASRLNREGYSVYSHDHRGHGKTDENANRGYIADSEGFEVLAENISELIDNAKSENEGLEVILFAHSMGSFVSLRFLELYSEKINRVILSGTNGELKPIASIGAIIARIEIGLLGRRHTSKLMDKLIFGAHNNKFKPARTNYDWICSNENSVDEYIKNPDCGFVCSVSFYYDLIRGVNKLHRNVEFDKINKSTKFFIFSGDMDPVGEQGKGLVSLANKLKKYGVNNTEYKLYKDGRHEMLNEKNKDEVMNDVIEFLDRT
ncbi:alpha/beta hydrolase [uncultured Clostridium sp.]|jgi:alpha-beta hydrolase superfamily lysophospholipase|uniref:alpha/beta hydrolase n=1 Tax=uncultured Clostridium sp. TaxID=59620 RepID=UPI002636B4D8|nr:alpha/beta hydrolase [uncultured Clostridium sp.]